MFDRRTLLLGAGLTLAGCDSPGDPLAAAARPLPATVRAARLVAAARAQLGVTVRYDAGYSRIRFPGGDVPRDRGACTDVVIRAYRDAFGLDLQALVNADMRAAFAAYPQRWGLSAPDPNIDHRRVPNLATFLGRHQAALPVPSEASGWQPATSSLRSSGVPAPTSGWSPIVQGGAARS
jgi:hypothetical protein